MRAGGGEHPTARTQHPTPTPRTQHQHLAPNTPQPLSEHPAPSTAQDRSHTDPTLQTGCPGRGKAPKKPRTARGGWQGFKARLNMQHPSHRAGQGVQRGSSRGVGGCFGAGLFGAGVGTAAAGRWARCAPPPLLLRCSRLEPPRGEPKFSAPQYPPPPGLPSWRRKETCEQAANA